MKKNILYILLIIILLLVIAALVLVIINLSKEQKTAPVTQVFTPQTVDTPPPVNIDDFAKYGITPREAMYYE